MPRVGPLIVVLPLALACCGDEPRGPGAAPGPSPEGGATIDFPDCHYSENPVVEVGRLPAQVWEPGAQPRLSQGQVLWHQRHTELGNMPDDIEIFRFDPVNHGTDQLTANDWDDRIVDAGDGGILFLTSDPGSDGYQLVLDRDGRQTVLEASLPRPIVVFELESRWVSRQAVTWLRPIEPPGAGYYSAVHLFEGGDVERVSGDLPWNGPPDLEGRELVWSASDGERRDIAYSAPELRDGPGDTWVWLTEDEVVDEQPLLSGGRVYWRAGTEPASIEIESGRVTRLEGLDCRDHAASNGLAVYVCVESSSDGVPPPHRLLLFDGEAERTVLEGRDLIFDLAMDGHALAWVEYPAEADFYEGAAGVVYYLEDVTDPDPEPIVVAPVGSGCWWCDAYWPEVDVRIGEGVLAWNYADPSFPPPPNPESFAVGYAVVEPSVRCTP